MMRMIVAVMVLLVLCVPALAIDIPNMVGNWTGTFDGAAWLKNTDYQTTGSATYYEANYTLAIKEQNGTRFVGKLISAINPLNSQVVLGVIGSDNKTITMVDERGYMWGVMNSSTEMELSYQTVDIDRIIVRNGIFKKE